MTDFERLKMVVGLVTYKPGWSFELSYMREYFGNYATLRIRYVGTDVNDPKKKMELNLLRQIWLEDTSRMTNLEIAERYIYYAVREAEQHEMDEWLKFAGKCIHEPHPEYKWETKPI